jgi:plastocyanin
VALALLIALVPGQASGADGVVTATRGGLYVPARVTITQGAKLTLVNLDADRHNLTAVRTGRDGNPRFQSTTVGPGETVSVRRVSTLKPGIYLFFCTVHEYQRGTLEVLPRIP